MQPRHERLIATVRDRTGTALRGVVAYDGGERALLYRRDDLGGAADRRIDAAARTAQQRTPLLAGTDASDRHADVELYDEAVIIHLREAADRGTLVSLDPEVARQLGGFISECSVALRAPKPGFEAGSASADG